MQDICFGAYDYEYEDHSSGYNDGDSVVTKNKLCMLVWCAPTTTLARGHTARLVAHTHNL